MIDQVMIKNIIGSTSAGTDATVRLLDAWYFLPVLICNSIFPAIINGNNDSEELYHQRPQNLFNLMIWTTLSTALLITIFLKHPL